jgi:hypothetical protein
LHDVVWYDFGSDHNDKIALSYSDTPRQVDHQYHCKARINADEDNDPAPNYRLHHNDSFVVDYEALVGNTHYY